MGMPTLGYAGDIAMRQARAAGGHTIGAARDLRVAARHAAFPAGPADVGEPGLGEFLVVLAGERPQQRHTLDAEQVRERPEKIHVLP